MNNFADETEMKKRERYAQDFYNKILDEEEHPIFCSDEACFLDLYVGDRVEAKNIILEAYNIVVTDEQLVMPFWKLLDFLYLKNKQKDI